MNKLPSQDEVNVFLDAVRKAGIVNMFGAGPIIQEHFNVSKYEAKDFLLTWMGTFSERARAGEVVE